MLAGGDEVEPEGDGFWVRREREGDGAVGGGVDVLKKKIFLRGSTTHLNQGLARLFTGAVHAES